MQVNQVDVSQRVIRLEPGTTKNREGREVFMTDVVRHLLAALVHGKKAEDFVFTRTDGKPVKAFRGTWRKACEHAGLPGLLFHESAENGRTEPQTGWRRRRRDYENRRLAHSQRL